MTNDAKLLQLKHSVTTTLVSVDTQELTGIDFKHFNVRQLELPTGLSLLDVQIDPVIIKRHPNHIDEDLNNDYFLTTLLEGRAHIQQAEQNYILEPGDMALMAGGLPYIIQYEQPSHRIIVRIPNQIFKERLVSTEQSVVIGILPNAGLGRVVNDLLQLVASEAEALSLTDQYTLTQSLIELTGALTRASLKSNQQQPHASKAILFNRIFAYLEEHYMDTELTPDKIAQDNGISKRYLHSLFRQSGTTVLKWVWERRLKAARSDLLDPVQANARISEIAYKRGFNDSAHFSRSFRHRFGLSPTKLRQRAHAQQEADESACKDK